MTGDTLPVAQPESPPAWMDLLGDLTGARVLVVPAARVSTPVPGEERWDVVILDGAVRPRGKDGRERYEAGLLRLASRLQTGGRLVVVADNPLSLLRAMDLCRGRPAGPAGLHLGQVERLLSRAGLRIVQRFGLLRSSAAAVTDFDLDAPHAAAAVLEAASVMTGGARALG
ncbi:MAG TPA: hypothetical protein VM287_10620, partial [Egibacteraceae bacterium]|nr:hypothetical protein [Egibacteraceae bacterium]